jgi:ATP-binding cassette, subfamily F, member 3
VLIGLESVEKSYGGQDVLAKVSFAVHAGDRVALVGRNGAGKSTVLRLLAGLEEPGGGRVFRGPNVAIRLLAQDPVFGHDSGASPTVMSVLEAAFPELDALEQAMHQLEGRLTEPEALHQYHELEEHYRLRGGYAREARRDMVLAALGFTGREHDPVAGLSGGERTRLALAQILVAQPEVLLLDEPTNHLDIEMVEWLEGFLRNYPGAMLLVSHDRAFLDQVAHKTVLVRGGELRSYLGNYTTFYQKFSEEQAILAATYRNEQRELERLEHMTEQMRIWGGRNEKLAKRARSMQKRLERFEDAMSDAPLPEEDVTRVQFSAADSGEIVLQAGFLQKSFGQRQLFSLPELTIRRGERIAMVGRNGVGKTTLLRLLLGLHPSDDARSFTRLGARVRLGYYDQQLRGVDPERTLYEEVRRMVDTDQGAHDLLGAYLFPYDAQYKTVDKLSGGERARLALLKLSLEECNFLVLDEPTNHLDMEMVESLEVALAEFPGTLLMISHDRRFIENLAEVIWLLEDSQLYTYPGGWRYYQEKHKDLKRQAQAGGLEAKSGLKPPNKSEAKRGFNPWKVRAKVAELEAEISQLEQEHTDIANELSNPTATSDFAFLGRRSQEVEGLLLARMQEWEDQQRLLEE